MGQPKHPLRFMVSDEVIDVIESLKVSLNVKTTAAVFRKTLAVLKLSVDQSRNSDFVVIIKGRGLEDHLGISVNLRH
jgi:hypothetical protein